MRQPGSVIEGRTKLRPTPAILMGLGEESGIPAPRLQPASLARAAVDRIQDGWRNDSRAVVRAPGLESPG